MFVITADVHIKSNMLDIFSFFIRLRTTLEGIKDGLLCLMWILVIYSSLKPVTPAGYLFVFSYRTFFSQSRAIELFYLL